MGTPPNALSVHHVSKQFGDIRALNDVSFDVPQNTVFSILGPNGAGKTTLLRILTTVTRPDAGRVLIQGLPVQTHLLDIRKHLGVVAQENHFDHYLSIWHNLTLHAQLHGLSEDEYVPRIHQLLEQVGLFKRRFSMPEDLSGGMQRRVSLIRALIHQPTLLFLDEPTTGLDPQARIEIWETIEAVKRSTTVILTSHYMEEADRLSDTILLINKGQVQSIGTPKDLKQALSPLNKYELVFKPPMAHSFFQDLQSRQHKDPQANGLHLTEPDSEYRLIFQSNNPCAVRWVLDQANMEDLVRFGQIEANLEDVFLALANTSVSGSLGLEAPTP